MESEGTPMAAGSGIGDKGKKVGTALDENPLGSPEYAKNVKQFDKEVDGISATMKGKDKKPLPMKAGSQIEKPKSEVGTETDEKDHDKSKIQVGKPGADRGAHMAGKGSSSDQQSGVASNKVKPGKVDSDPKHMGENAEVEGGMKPKIDKLPKAGSGEPAMDGKKDRMAEWKKKRMESLRAKRGQKKEDGEPAPAPKADVDPAPEAPAADAPKEPKEGQTRRKLPEWAKKKA
jgi:hypothetical protein